MTSLKRKLAENLRHPKGLYGWFIGQFMNHFNDGIINQTVDLLPDTKEQCIVEVGIGSGKALHLTSQKYPDALLYGLDISTKMIASAGRRNRDLVKSGKLKLHLTSIDSIPLANDSVDTLFTINTIYFWKDLDLACREVHRVLKTGGRFIISFNPKENMKEDVYPDDLFQFVTVDDVNKLVGRNGFKKGSFQLFNDRYEKYASLVAIKE